MPAALTVRAAGFAPVKGMRHLALDRVELDAAGPVGDRQWCLVDVREQRVLRTVQHPSLMAVVARTEGDSLAITLQTGESAAGAAVPTGETITCDYWGRQVPLALTDGPHAELVSAYLEKDVRLAEAPRGSVVFGSPVTLVGTATLDDLGAQGARFRPTLVVETDEPFVEDTWLGREVEVGTARLRIGVPVPRCAVVDHHPETGVKDLRLLGRLVASRPTNRANEPLLGVYADVVRPGVVEV